MFFEDIIMRFDDRAGHSTEPVNVTTAGRCFDTEQLYSLGICCDVCIEFLEALLLSRSICNVLLENFFSYVKTVFFPNINSST